MSVLNTINLVKNFVQSDSCKLSCSDIEEPYYLYSGSMEGDFISNDRCETPIRSCGCKAQRVLDRTRRSKGPEYCFVWDYHLYVVCKGITVTYNRINALCSDCCYERHSLPTNGFKTYSRQFFGHELCDEKPMYNQAHLPWDASIRHTMHVLMASIPLLIKETFNGNHNYEFEGNGLDEADFDRAHTCWMCNRSLVHVIEKSECAECYLRTPELLTEIQINDSEEDENVYLDDYELAMQDLNLGFLDDPERGLQTPPPTFEVFEEARDGLPSMYHYVPHSPLPPSPFEVEPPSPENDVELEHYLYDNGYY